MSDEPDLFERAAARRARPSTASDSSPGSVGLADRAVPLAERMRPRRLEEVVGQERLLASGRLLREMLEGGHAHSLLLWGPPGCGKTTIARLLSQHLELPFTALSAVLAGVKDVRAIVDKAEYERRASGRPTLLFLDEIHRFNKAQQDALLPHVEAGTLVLVGATTENPSFEVIAPLLSRLRVLTLDPLDEAAVAALAERALGDSERGLGESGLGIENDALSALAQAAQGDARMALGTLEVAAELAARASAERIEARHVAEAAQARVLRHDRSGEEHFNVVSAFIKSLRGGDADAALYYLARMLEAGEDPLFIARRMVIFASEDIGNADPRALSVAVAVKDAVHFVGLPEGRIPLAQGVTFLAGAPKSNASYVALDRALEEVRRSGALPVPMHLRNAPTALMREHGYGKGYQYPHDHEGHWVDEDYLPEKLRGRRFFEPSDQGEEAESRKRLDRRRS